MTPMSHSSIDWSGDLYAQRDAVEAHIRACLKASEGGIRRRNANKGHWYQALVDGRWEYAPGVTTVLGVLDKSRPLMIWASRLERQAAKRVAWDAYRDEMPAGLSEEAFADIFEQYADKSLAYVKALEEACDIGTGLHALVEHRTREMLGENVGAAPKVHDAAEWLFPKWEEWAAEVEYQPIAAEFVLHGRCPNPTAGTADVLAWIRRKLTLADWKTANGLYTEMHVQNVVYRKMASDLGCFPMAACEGLLVRIPKSDTDPRPFETAEVDKSQDEERLTVFGHLRAVQPWKKEEDAKGLEEWRKKKDKERAA